MSQSLSKRGISVTIFGEKGRQNIAFYGKYPKSNNAIYPSPDDEDLFVKILLGASKNYDVLIPLHERTIIPISKHLRDFKRIVKVTLPNYETLEISLDKAKTIRLAERLGVPTPHTFFVEKLDDLKQLSTKLHYPVVIKLREEIHSPPPRYEFAYSPSDLIVKYRVMHAKCEYPLIQERIKGIGFGFFTLFDKTSTPVANFCHKRIREYPITGGISTFCESVYEPKIIDYGIRLLKSVKWQGPAMVEFRKDGNGEFRLMEINPRFWGSLPLPIASGIDFPYLLYEMGLKDTVNPSCSYKVGVKYRFLYHDSLALKQALLNSNDRFEYLANYIRSFGDRNTHTDFSTILKALLIKRLKGKW